VALPQQRSARRTVIVGALGVLLGAAAFGAPVSAAPPQPARPASPTDLTIGPTRLTLTVAGTSGAPRSATLRSDPPGGTHRQAVAACAALSEVDGELAALRVSNGMCFMVYDPVVVTATGVWRGRQVRFRHTFGNSCTLRNNTGPVFRI